MTHTPDPEMVVGGADFQLLEEHVRHVGVEMLAGVNDDLLDLIMMFHPVDGATDHRRLDKLWSSPDHRHDLHACSPRWFIFRPVILTTE